MRNFSRLGIILFFVLTSVFIVYAEDMEVRSVETILAEIQQEQDVQDPEDIAADQVSDAILEELGDSVMEAMIGNRERHEQMDIRLGGEGSASLTAFHIKLGYNYLLGYPNGMMTLMTSGMMGPSGNNDSVYNWGGMMRGNNYSNYNGNIGMMGYFGWGGMLMGALILILLVAAVILAVRAFNRKPTSLSGESPLDILKKRFVNGEIDKEEYERMMELLRK